MSFAVSIDTSESAAWAGYMNVFENNAGAKAAICGEVVGEQLI